MYFLAVEKACDPDNIKGEHIGKSTSVECHSKRTLNFNPIYRSRLEVESRSDKQVKYKEL